MSLNQDIESTARVGLKRLREYLEEPNEDRETVARVGIAAVRAHTSAESTATRKLSAAISAAKFMGVSGEALRPVFESLAGQPALLPDKRELSGATASEAP